MKKFRGLSVILCIAMILSALNITVMAEEKTITAYITVSKYGEIVKDKNGDFVALAELTLTGKESYTLDDAFYAAHEKYYDGGAAAGYAAADSEWGLSVTKVWGDTSGKFGYQVNAGTVSVWGPTQEINDGDRIDLAVYKNFYPDTESYAIFDIYETSAYIGSGVFLTLYESYYGENWETLFKPCANAQILINGQETPFATDEQGRCKIPLAENLEGKAVISAKKTKELVNAITEEVTTVAAITAPVCVVYLKALPVHYGGGASVWDGSVADGFAAGSGTENYPYIIANAAQLAYFAQSVNDGTTYEGQYILLVNDIVLNSSDMFATDENGSITGAASDKTPYEWTAIGSVGHFSGTFDGGNHEVKGIYINKPDTSYQGLFGCCQNATIKNICVTDGYINGRDFVGGVVGSNYAYSGSTATVSNCYNTGSVTGSDQVGGIVGQNYADSDTAIVSNCYNTGSVAGSSYVGGVTGYNYAYSSGSTATVSDCYNTGSVTGRYYEVGGVVGWNHADYSGSATVLDCYNTGSITGTGGVGGVVGENYAGYCCNATVSDCYNTGSVTGSGNCVGGVVGENYAGYYGNATVSDCYNTGSVTGGDFVGGVVGLNEANSGNATVSNCYNTGSVTGNGSSVGGVVGENYYGTISDCYYLYSCIETANDYGVALTSSQMEQQDSFAGFDFDTVWTMEGNPDYPYPELIGMYYGGSSPIIDEPTIIESGTCGDNLTWTLDDEGTLIISGTGAMTNYSLGRSPFYTNANIKTVIIEDGVTNIGDEAFSYCSSLADVKIGSGVTSIGKWAFNDCTALTSIEIPDNVTSIGEWVFSKCSSLADVKIGSRVTSIENGTFSDCSSLTSVEIPDSVTSISRSAFQNCTSLNSVNVSKNNAYYSSADGVLFNRDKTEIIYYPRGKSGTYTIPDSIISIGDYAFCDCDRLTSIEIPAGVESIGEWAFSNCNSLTAVKIGSGVTKISGWAFLECTSLNSIEIPGSVTYIGDWAFDVCTGLTDVYYIGSEEMWNGIEIGENNDYLLNATMHFAVEPIENKGIIKIGTAKGKAGRTVDVTVSLENNPGITSMLLNIDYDNSALTLTNVADSGILGSTCHSDNFANAPYSLYWNNGTATENFTANGVIATLTFEIDEGAYVGDYPITVWYNSDDILDFDLDEVYFDTENGNVSVISFIYGDVNGDEKITLKDDAFLARYLAHWIGYDETNVDLDAADVNADGKVGVRDNAILARHLAKWIGYEELPYSN